MKSIWALCFVILAKSDATGKRGSINCRTLLQYGEPRSGSTFQYWLLESISALKKFRYNVSKTHRRPNFNKISPECVFRSVKTNWDHDVYAYTQRYSEFSAHPLTEVKKLGILFDLDKNELRQLHAHMKYWSILRRCCGSQSSIDHRNQMHNSNQLHHSFEAYDFMECNMYNISQVELYITRTTVYRLLKQAQRSLIVEFYRPPWHLGYCQKADQKLRDGFDFNDKKIL